MRPINPEIGKKKKGKIDDQIAQITDYQNLIILDNALKQSKERPKRTKKNNSQENRIEPIVVTDN